MIAANDTDVGFLLRMAPDQLRTVIAHAGGLLAFQVGQESAARTMHRVGDRLLRVQHRHTDWLSCRATLSLATRDAVIREVAEETGFSPQEILTSNKRKGGARARMLAMWKLRQMKNERGLPKYSYPEIGRAFDRDHTTAISSCRKIQREMDDKAQAVAA